MLLRWARAQVYTYIYGPKCASRNGMNTRELEKYGYNLSNFDYRAQGV